MVSENVDKQVRKIMRELPYSKSTVWVLNDSFEHEYDIRLGVSPEDHVRALLSAVRDIIDAYDIDRDWALSYAYYKIYDEQLPPTFFASNNSQENRGGENMQAIATKSPTGAGHTSPAPTPGSSGDTYDYAPDDDHYYHEYYEERRESQMRDYERSRE